MDTTSIILIVMSVFSLVMTGALIVVTIIQAIVLQNVSRSTQKLAAETFQIIARMDERFSRTSALMEDLVDLKKKHVQLTEYVLRLVRRDGTERPLADAK